MKKFISIILLVAIMVASSGCASYMSQQASERELIGKRVKMSGDTGAIKAYNLGQNAVGIGIDVAFLESLTEHPVRQFLAALTDAAILYGIGYGVNELLDDSDDSGSTVPSTATDSTFIDVKNSDSGQVTITINPKAETPSE